MGAGGGAKVSWVGLVGGGCPGGRGLACDSPLPWNWFLGHCLPLGTDSWLVISRRCTSSAWLDTPPSCAHLPTIVMN